MGARRFYGQLEKFAPFFMRRFKLFFETRISSMRGRKLLDTKDFLTLFRLIINSFGTSATNLRPDYLCVVDWIN